MVLNKIPLSVRLERIKKGYAGDPAYVTSAIRRMADMPVSVYMDAFPEEKKIVFCFAHRMGIETEDITYKELVWHIQKLYKSLGPQADMIDRAWLNQGVLALAAPLVKYWSERGGKAHE